MIKKVISKVLSWFKSLFLKLRVVVTLQVGKDEEDEPLNPSEHKDSEKGELHD